MYGLSAADASRLMAALSRAGLGVRFAERPGGTEVRIAEFRGGRARLTKVLLADLGPRRSAGMPAGARERAGKPPRSACPGEYPGTGVERRVRLLSRPAGRVER